jgi:hypothetical protein
MKRNFNFFVEKTIPEETSAARSTLYIFKSGNPFQQKRERKLILSPQELKVLSIEMDLAKKVVSFQKAFIIKARCAEICS